MGNSITRVMGRENSFDPVAHIERHGSTLIPLQVSKPTAHIFRHNLPQRRLQVGTRGSVHLRSDSHGMHRPSKANELYNLRLGVLVAVLEKVTSIDPASE